MRRLAILSSLALAMGGGLAAESSGYRLEFRPLIEDPVALSEANVPEDLRRKIRLLAEQYRKACLAMDTDECVKGSDPGVLSSLVEERNALLKPFGYRRAEPWFCSPLPVPSEMPGDYSEEVCSPGYQDPSTDVLPLETPFVRVVPPTETKNYLVLDSTI